MDLRLIIFCCLLGVTTVLANQGGFYFPDQLTDAKAESNSDAWSDGHGNSHATANSNAVSSSNGGDSRYPNFYKPPGHGFGGHGDFEGRYPSQGYGHGYENPLPPYDPRPSYPLQGGNNAQSNANAQSNSQGFGGNSISNAIANSLGSNGGASSAAAAAAAGTSFVNGIPVASASAAAAAAVASPHGGSSSAVSSSATAGGSVGGGHFQGPNYPHGGSFGYEQPIQHWLYRSGFDDQPNDAVVVDSATAAARSADSEDAIVFKD